MFAVMPTDNKEEIRVLIVDDHPMVRTMVRMACDERDGLTVVGEAARRLSTEVRAGYPDVPWQLIGDFRNLAVHNYFSVEWSLVWSMAGRDVPRLLEQVTAILAEWSPAVLAALDEPPGTGPR